MEEALCQCHRRPLAVAGMAGRPEEVQCLPLLLQVEQAVPPVLGLASPQEGDTLSEQLLLPAQEQEAPLFLRGSEPQACPSVDLEAGDKCRLGTLQLSVVRPSGLSGTRGSTSMALCKQLMP